MNIQEYIQSGVLEQYALGLLSTEEMHDVEEKACLHSEIKVELQKVESSLEEFAKINSVNPRPEIKARIMSAIENVPVQKKKEMTGVQKENAIIPEERPMRFTGWMAIAASLILIIGVSSFYFYSNWKNSEKTIASQQQELASIQNADKQMQDAVTAMSDPATSKIVMSGTANHPGMVATVYWNKSTQTIYLQVNNLPTMPHDWQYQLWAIGKNGPQDAGVFDPQTGMIKMKNAGDAQAFAITLEKRGGSTAPTLSNMYVIGKVQG
jgi:anti-sigma-K factor RskA